MNKRIYILVFFSLLLLGELKFSFQHIWDLETTRQEIQIEKKKWPAGILIGIEIVFSDVL